MRARPVPAWTPRSHSFASGCAAYPERNALSKGTTTCRRRPLGCDDAGSNDREVGSIDGIERIEDRAARRFPHGEVIVHQGDASTCLFLVTGGAVRLSSVTAAGREVVVALLCPGDVFGESALLGTPSPVEARAVGRTTLVAVPLASLRALLERHPATGEQLLRLVAARLHRTSTALEEALVGDLPSRILGRLRDLAAGHGVREPEGVRLTLPITQDELARMVGASRESVSRSVGALVAKGLVRSERRRLVLREPSAREGGEPSC